MHQRFANQLTAVGDGVFVAVPLQRTHLAIVEHDTHTMASACLRYSLVSHGQYVFCQKNSPNRTPACTILRPVWLVNVVSSMVSFTSIFACCHCTSAAI